MTPIHTQKYSRIRRNLLVTLLMFTPPNELLTATIEKFYLVLREMPGSKAQNIEVFQIFMAHCCNTTQFSRF